MAAVRDVGFLAWRDPRAWMEDMRSPRWRERVRREQEHTAAAVEKAVADLPTPASAAALALSFEAAQKEDEALATWSVEAGTTRLRITPQAGSSWAWSFESDGPTQEPVLVGSLDLATGGYVVYTRDTGKGGERYAITAQRRGKILWTAAGGKEGVGNEIALLQGRVYCIEADAPLQYRRLVSLDAATGGGRQVHYEERNPRVSLHLWRGEGRCLFLVGEDAGRQSVWWIRPGAAPVRLSPEGVCFVLAGIAPGGTEPCYLVRRGSVTAPWEAVGDPLAAWTLPPGLSKYGVDAIRLAAGILVTRAHGERQIVRCGQRGRPARPGPSFLAELEFHPFTAWQGRLGVTAPVEIQMTVPGVPRMRAWIRTGHRGRAEAAAEIDIAATTGAGECRRMSGWATSRDGTAVRWISVWRDTGETPKGLLLCGYGAYGLPTLLSTARWKPWIDRGWAIGIALVRGGGDHTEAWADAGRLGNKIASVEDFEACLEAVKGVTGVPAERTWIYGRSAGGYLVGAATARAAAGRKSPFRGVYAEVPYVDVLRTASNPDLPLTVLEYNEFGNPARSIAEFEGMLRLSPVDALPETGAPGIAAVCRTGLNDRQVFAYEAVKWVDALRGGGKGSKDAYVAIGEGQGHFTRGGGVWIERAEDLLLVEWLSGREMRV